MSMQYIRKFYGVPAKRGGRVVYSGRGTARHGTICGSRDAYLLVRLDGDKRSKPMHPQWMMEYV